MTAGDEKVVVDLLGQMKLMASRGTEYPIARKYLDGARPQYIGASRRARIVGASAQRSANVSQNLNL